MDWREIRKLIITAMFSDDVLVDHLVLKGGNALNLVLGIGNRSSLDVDFSIEGDFEDLDDIERRIARALSSRFASVGLVVFDPRMKRRPAIAALGRLPRWGGYLFEFKLESRDISAERTITERRRRALVIGQQTDRKVFRIEISKHEYCARNQEADLDNYTVSVYSPEMLAIEKVRAICQQMPDYALRSRPAARARDFYDIHAILTEKDVDLRSEENLELFRTIFAAKEVPLSLIPRISDHRDFHRADWPRVEASVSGHLESFDFYFAFVIGELSRLHALWEE